MKINRGNWLHLLGYNKATQRYSKWGATTGLIVLASCDFRGHRVGFRGNYLVDAFN